MNSPWSIKHLELLQELDNSSFRLLTQQQVTKDFAQCGLSFPEDFTTKTFSFDESSHFVSVLVADCMSRGEKQLLQLLYTIDFPEANFLALVNQTDFLEKLSKQIILREAYKVWLRKMYS